MTISKPQSNFLRLTFLVPLILFALLGSTYSRSVRQPQNDEELHNLIEDGREAHLSLEGLVYRLARDEGKNMINRARLEESMWHNLSSGSLDIRATRK